MKYTSKLIKQSKGLQDGRFLVILMPFVEFILNKTGEQIEDQCHSVCNTRLLKTETEWKEIKTQNVKISLIAYVGSNKNLWNCSKYNRRDIQLAPTISFALSNMKPFKTFWQTKAFCWPTQINSASMLMEKYWQF